MSGDRFEVFRAHPYPYPSWCYVCNRIIPAGEVVVSRNSGKPWQIGPCCRTEIGQAEENFLRTEGGWPEEAEVPRKGGA